jgi:hypothetical protein
MTTIEFQTMRGRLSHELLKNELILRLLDEQGQKAVRQRGDIEKRAKTCADILAANAEREESRNNLRYASIKWIQANGTQKILELIEAARSWEKYDITDEFTKQSEAIKAEMSDIADFFSKIDDWAKRDRAERAGNAHPFWRSMLRIHDFVRALDERDQDFQRFMY